MPGPDPFPRLTLHVDCGREWRGGQAQVFNLCAAMQEKGLPFTLLCPEGSPLAEKGKGAGFSLLHLPLKGELDFVSAWKLKRWLKANRPDVVHAHDAHAHSVLLAALPTKGGPLFCVSRRVDFPIKTSFFSRRKYLDPRVHYLAISNGVRKVLETGGVAPEKIRVVPSGVQPNRFPPAPGPEKLRATFSLPQNCPIIGTVGSLVDHKGHRFLIEAAPLVLEKVPEARFLIVGDGELREDLEKRIAQAGLEERIILAGYRRDLELFLGGFTIFALPSHLEGLCTSLIDALLFEIPAVGCDTGGVPDLILPGKTGLLVPPRNPEALGKAILTLLNNPEKAAQLAKFGKKLCLQHFTAEKMADHTLESYQYFNRKHLVA